MVIVQTRSRKQVRPPRNPKIILHVEREQLLGMCVRARRERLAWTWRKLIP